MRKSLGFGLLSILLVVSLAQAAPTMIRYATVGTPDEEVGYEAIVNAFNTAQDKINVKIEFNPGGWEGHRDKILANILGGMSPDVIRVSESMFAEFVSLGMFRDLSAFIERDNIDLRDYFRPALATNQIAGRQYGIPLGIKVNAFAYNRDLFRESGLAFPGLDWHWGDQLVSAVRKLTVSSSDDRPGRFGMSANWSLVHMADLIWSFGGELFSSDFDKMLLDQPESLAALQLYWDLLYIDRVSPAPRGGGLGPFLQGNVGIWTTGAWEIVRLRNTPPIFDWDFTAKPQGPAGRVQAIRGSSYAIPNSSADAEAAWEFVKFTMSLEGSRVALNHLVEGVPIHRKLIRDWNEQQRPPYHPEEFIHVIETGRPYTLPSAIQHVESAMNQAGWTQMVGGEIPPRVMVDRVVPVVNAILAAQ